MTTQTMENKVSFNDSGGRRITDVQRPLHFHVGKTSLPDASQGGQASACTRTWQHHRFAHRDDVTNTGHAKSEAFGVIQDMRVADVPPLVHLGNAPRTRNVTAVGVAATQTRASNIKTLECIERCAKQSKHAQYNSDRTKLPPNSDEELFECSRSDVNSDTSQQPGRVLGRRTTVIFQEATRAPSSRLQTAFIVQERRGAKNAGLPKVTADANCRRTTVVLQYCSTFEYPMVKSGQGSSQAKYGQVAHVVHTNLHKARGFDFGSAHMALHSKPTTNNRTGCGQPPRTQALNSYD